MKRYPRRGAPALPEYWQEDAVPMRYWNNRADLLRPLEQSLCSFRDGFGTSFWLCVLNRVRDPSQAVVSRYWTCGEWL